MVLWCGCSVSAAECFDSSVVGIAHAAGESILCRDGWRRGSSQITLGFLVTQLFQTLQYSFGLLGHISINIKHYARNESKNLTSNSGCSARHVCTCKGFISLDPVRCRASRCVADRAAPRGAVRRRSDAAVAAITPDVLPYALRCIAVTHGVAPRRTMTYRDAPDPV